VYVRGVQSVRIEGVFGRKLLDADLQFQRALRGSQAGRGRYSWDVRRGFILVGTSPAEDDANVVTGVVRAPQELFYSKRQNKF
jgi:hypothetical protein